MPEDNIALIKRAFEAFQREGIEGILPFLHEDVEWRNPVDSPMAAVWHGHEGVRDWYRQASEAFGEMRFAPDEFRELSESSVLVLMRFGLTGTTSDLQMEVPFAHVIDLRDGQATSLTMYSDQQEALAAVGLER